MTASRNRVAMVLPRMGGGGADLKRFAHGLRLRRQYIGIDPFWTKLSLPPRGSFCQDLQLERRRPRPHLTESASDFGSAGPHE